jgi:hypothetical protein
MPLFISALLGGLATVLTSLVGRILFALGISYVSFTGITTMSDYAMSLVKNSLGGLPIEILNLVAYMWIDKAITLVFSAVVASFAIRLGGSDTLTSMVIKK